MRSAAFVLLGLAAVTAGCTDSEENQRLRAEVEANRKELAKLESESIAARAEADDLKEKNLVLKEMMVQAKRYERELEARIRELQEMLMLKSRELLKVRKERDRAVARMQSYKKELEALKKRQK